MPLRPRCGYAAVLPRSLPGSSCLPPQEFPARHEGRVRAAPGPDPPGSSRCRIKGLSRIGSSRTPLRTACRTRTIWQSWTVPALSGLLPPFPAVPGSGCPQLRRPAATGTAVKVSHLHSNLSASPRTHDLRHTCVTLLLDLGTPPHVVQEIVGHSAIEVTMTIYAHVSLDEKRKALRKLGEALG
jgi:integrase